MKTPLKKACVLSLSAALGEIVYNQVDQDGNEVALKKDEQVLIDNAILLHTCGQKALTKANVKKDRRMQNRAAQQIDRLVKARDEFNIVELLSVLLLGVQDFLHYDKNNELLKELEQIIEKLIYAYNPKYLNDEDEEHEIAYNRYIEWTEGE